MLDMETAWQAIGARYADESVAKALLAAQDLAGLDVTLTLLLDQLEQAHIPLPKAVWPDLMACSGGLQAGLQLQRDERRSLKNRAGYEAAKARELEMEKAALRAYVMVLADGDPTGSISQPLDQYVQHLGEAVAVVQAIDVLRQSRSNDAAGVR